MTTTKTDWVEKIGKPAYQSIADMVAALECDYDRLEELKDERAGYTPLCCCEAAEHTPETCSPNCGCSDCWDTWDDPSRDIEGPDGTTPRQADWAKDNPDDAEELAELEEAAGDCTDREDAERRISEDPLSVRIFGERVNGEWEADRFEILLATGGPAVRIMGELDGNGEPDRAWLEVQDWFKPWTQYYPADSDTLLTYCRQFCFE